MSGQAERGRYKGSIPHCPERPLDQGFTPIAARNHSFSATLGVARLHAGLAIDAVVEHHDREIAGRWMSMVASEPIPISISPPPVLTATRRLGYASARPRPIMAAPPPKLRSPSPSAGRSQVVEPRRDTTRKSSPVGEQRSHGGAALQSHLVHTFLPISCCDSSTAPMRSSPKHVLARRARPHLRLRPASSRDRPPPRTA